MSKAKNIFIAATDKDVGKSTISFAIINKLISEGKKVGFMKPIGQRWRKSKWGEVEEDVILIKEIYKLEDNPSDMNPIVIKRGYTEKYLYKKIKPDINLKIKKGYENIAKNKDFVIVEGTGHAGVGSVLKNSNAQVAKILDSKVVLLAKGGIGRSIDKLELNRAFFEKKGVDVIGVIINKVISKKADRVKKAIKKYCKRHNMKFFGAIPYSPILGNPTLGTVIEELKPKIIQETGERNLVIDQYLVGASNVKEAIKFIKATKGNILLVLPSERMDLTLSILHMKKIENFKNSRVFTLLFSGGKKPEETTMEILKDYKINVLWKKGDTFSVISALSSISIKTSPLDNFKIKEINDVVGNNIKLSYLLDFLKHPNIIYTNMEKIKRYCFKIFKVVKKWIKKIMKKN